MKVKDCNFKIGELYIFSPSEHWAKTDPLLWGIFDKQTPDGQIMLEASTRDFINFTLWLPSMSIAAWRLAPNCVISYSTAASGSRCNHCR